MEYYSQYKFNFYLNATHAIFINDGYGTLHPHTWEIALHTIKMKNDFVQFQEIEDTIESILDKYQNRCINDFEPFDILNPTLEHITQFFMEQFQKALQPLGWLVFMIEVSETPTRSYIISTVENHHSVRLKRENQPKSIIKKATEEE